MQGKQFETAVPGDAIVADGPVECCISGTLQSKAQTLKVVRRT
jgi:hypothetical protein